MSQKGNEHWVFPQWHNKIPLVFFGIVGPVATLAVIAAVWYYFSPRFTDVGYMPEQPVPYSHQLHAGELGMDCRYCHTGAERASSARVPPTQTCMTCHTRVKTQSADLRLVRASWVEDKPIEWVRIHKTPDYAYFEHSAHMQAGVGCESCHGRIDQMVEVAQDQPLNMGWCLDCHREPERHLRPVSELTTMGYAEKRHAAQQASLEARAESFDGGEAIDRDALNDLPRGLRHELTEALSGESGQFKGLDIQDGLLRRQVSMALRAHAADFSLDDMRAELTREGEQIKESQQINPPVHCSGCHR